MTNSQLSTSNVTVPAWLIQNRAIPAAMLQTWVLLRSLAPTGDETPPLSMQQLAEVTGKSPSSLHRHLAFLKSAGALDWRPGGWGVMVYSFATEHGSAVMPSGFGLPEAREGEGGSQNGENDSQTWERDSQEWESVPQGYESESQKWVNDSQPWDSDSQKLEKAPQNWEKDSRKWENRPPSPSFKEDPITKEELKREGDLLDSPQQENQTGKGRIPDASLSAKQFREAKPAPRGRKLQRPGNLKSGGTPENLVVDCYRRMAGMLPNPSQQALLAAQVSDLEKWGATLEHWLSHGWNPKNIAGQLELYQRGGPGACRYCQAEKTPLDQSLDTLGEMRKELAHGQRG
jgi:hypothetical protein